MTNPSEQAWWRRTRELAIVTLVFSIALGVALFVLQGPFDGGKFFSLPFGYFLLAQALPAVFAVLIFWSANRQAEIDRRFGLTED